MPPAGSDPGGAGPRGPGAKLMRINRYLALCGAASRRQAMDLVFAGRVQVNEHVVRDPGYQVCCGRDRVLLDAQPVRMPRQWLYYVFHKPRGVVVSMHDEQGRGGLQPHLHRIRQAVFPVGRLDRNSEGLLLLTNHGELGHRLLHPSSRIEKLYLVSVAPRPRPWQLERMSKGIPLGGGDMSGPAAVRVRRANRRGAVLRVTLTEGKKRELRRMCRAVGLRVLRLRRVAFAGIKLEGLPPGEHRRLSRKEVAALAHLIGMEL